MKRAPTQPNRRWRLVADFRLQSLLCLRIVMYWLFCQASMVVTILGFNMLVGIDQDAAPPSIWRLLVPALFVSSLLLPVMLLDILMFSNRFAGPMLNLRRKLKSLAEGQPTPKLQFRAADFLQEICDDFNRLRSRILFAPVQRHPPQIDQATDATVSPADELTTIS